MNTELKEAIEALEKEKNISSETLFEAIENALMTACKSNFGKADNIRVSVDRDTFEYSCIAEKKVVETEDDVEDKLLEIPLSEAVKVNPSAAVGDTVDIKINSQSFGRIATQIAKNVILQKIREEERKVIYNDYFEKERDITTGTVQRLIGKNISINLGRCDTILTEAEQVKGEVFKPTDRIKLFVVEVKDTPRGPRITVSRTHPELVKRLFEQEVTEVRDGTVEIKAIAREAGSRTKMAVWSNDPNVDAYIDSIYSEIRYHSMFGNTENKYLDLVLNKYQAICSETGITFTISVKTANLSFIEPADLITLLSNILDNAVEAAKDSKERTIELSVNRRNGFDVLTCANSCDSPPLSEGKRLFTTKKSAGFHGLGVKSIEKTATKYRGEFDWVYDGTEKQFIVNIAFFHQM